MPPPVTGGHVTGPLVITRSGWFVVAVRHVVAFPAGVEVEAVLHERPLAKGFPGRRGHDCPR